MGRRRKLPVLTLTDEDRDTLRVWYGRRKTAQALRSTIVARNTSYTPPMRPLALSMVLGAGSALAQVVPSQPAPAPNAPFCAQIQTMIQDSPAHWGVSVTTLDGTVLCALNAAQLFRPASNNKLFTTAAALAILGPDHTFETQVFGFLDPSSGRIKGDLTLAGGGDPNLDSGDLPYAPPSQRKDIALKPFTFRALDDLAGQLAARGVKSVEGDLVGSDTKFPYEPLVPTWELEDAISDDGVPVSALSVGDNALKLSVTSASGNPVVTLDQHGVPFYSVDAAVTPRPSSEPGGVRIERVPGSRSVRVYGSVAAANPESEDIAVDDPALYAAMAFRQLLEVHGIRVQGTVRSEHDFAGGNGLGYLAQLRSPLDAENRILKSQPSGVACPVFKRKPALATHRSAPLAQDVVYTDKVSQNLHAELMLRSLGGFATCGHGSLASGARMVRAFLLQSGVADGDFILYDGSGLSSHDLVTPRSLTQLLTYAAKQPWFDLFKSALPIGGVDGSLSNRFSETLKGKVFAKTGSLGESRALSGYLTAASGQTVVFSVMDDNHPPGSTVDRTLMDQIVAAIAGPIESQDSVILYLQGFVILNAGNDPSISLLPPRRPTQHPIRLSIENLPSSFSSSCPRPDFA